MSYLFLSCTEVFDSDDKFELTYYELVDIISKARMAGPKLIPVLGTVN